MLQIAEAKSAEVWPCIACLGHPRRSHDCASSIHWALLNCNTTALLTVLLRSPSPPYCCCCSPTYSRQHISGRCKVVIWLTAPAMRRGYHWRLPELPLNGTAEAEMHVSTQMSCSAMSVNKMKDQVLRKLAVCLPSVKRGLHTSPTTMLLGWQERENMFAKAA